MLFVLYILYVLFTSNFIKAVLSLCDFSDARDSSFSSLFPSDVFQLYIVIFGGVFFWKRTKKSKVYFTGFLPHL